MRPTHSRPSSSPPANAPAPNATPADPLVAWILAQAGLDPSAYRPDFAARRSAACLRHLRVSSPAMARRLLNDRPDLLPGALDVILIGISGFFRDQGVFDRLRGDVLPHLLESHGTLRVLGAGVSSGMEMYSVAMLLDELGELDRAELVGLDCRASAIAHARSGAYDAGDVAELPAAQRAKYFTPTGGKFVASQRLRGAITWRCANLLQFTAGGSYQLILFRNVAIYLRPEASAPLWSALCNQLDRGGVLVTGKGERPPRELPVTRFGPSLYRRH